MSESDHSEERPPLNLNNVNIREKDEPSTSKDSPGLNLSTCPRFSLFNVATLAGYPFKALTRIDLFRKKSLFRRHNDEPFMSYHSCNTSILGTMKHPFWSQVFHLYPQMNFTLSSVFSYSEFVKDEKLGSRSTMNIEDYVSPSSSLSLGESFPSSETASWTTQDVEIESLEESETDIDSDATSTPYGVRKYFERDLDNKRTKDFFGSTTSSEAGSELGYNRRIFKQKPQLTRKLFEKSVEKVVKLLTDIEGESGYHSESPSPPAPSLSSIPVTQTIPTTTVPGNPPIASNVSFPSVTVPNMYYDPNEISHMDVLSEQIFHFHSITAQTEFTLDRKLQLRDMLYYAITPIFPMCGLYVVGSSLNGFGTNNSDMDLCLMLTSKDLDQKTDAITVLKTISESLHNAPFVKSQHLIDTAKVPILRLNFNAPFEDVTVDLNANNSVAIRNTHLLCYYATFDWRVRPLVAVVKEWAKQRGINESTRSSFTSYSLVLMVINYLQYGAEPSVLPSLQKLYPNRFSHKNDIRMLNVSVPLESTFQTRWTSSNNQSLGELLLGFLEYYSNRFSYETEAISVRLGKTISREKIMRHQEQHQGALTWNCIWIEEPFTRMNTAHSVFDWNIFENIKKTFVDSYHELRGNSDFESFISKPPLPLMGIKSSSNVEIEDVLVENNTSATQLDATDPNMKPELNPE